MNAPAIGSSPFSQCFSGRCQPRGRTTQHRGLFVEPVGLAFGGREREVAAHRVHQVGLALDEIGPGRAQRILEVRHEDVGAGVERIDDHLALGRSRDLDAPVEEVLRNRGDSPLRGAQRPRFLREVRQPAGVELALFGRAAGEQSRALVREALREVIHEGDGFRRQHRPPFRRRWPAAACLQ